MMKKLLKACVLFHAVVLLVASANAQLLTWSPTFIKETSAGVEITGDASKGNQGLFNHTPTNDVYVHIGVITTFSTSSSDWKHVPFTWGSTNAISQASYLGNNKWKYTIGSDLRTFFNVTDPTERILKIALLFRNGTGSKKLANADNTDMYIPVYDNGLYARIDQPFKEPKYFPVAEPVTASAGDPIPVNGLSSQVAKLRVLFNGDPKDSVMSGTSISTSVNAVSGNNQLVLEVSNTNGTSYDTINFFVNTPVVVAAQPANTVDGINYHPDNTSATLVLFAPNKTRAAVIGDFNNWTQTTSYQMNRTPDGNRYWITLTGLTPGTEYAYQYLIDGNLRVADIYSEKVLDPWNDQYIPTANYPSLKPYPAGQSNIVGVLQTAKPGYSWTVPNFTRPDKRNLIIYELLLRDFVGTQNWQTLKDTLSYLKRLGINAIEVMPFNEFEGNNSWGYNPDFYFAPDKMYGTETALKQFIDVCHQNGIAVIMDMALNHAFGLSPTVRMYWDAVNNKPSVSNPWHNPDATHPFNVGYDFNHESEATKYLVSRVIRHWMVNYKIDGFRWDLSKGFTQTNSGANVGLWGNYDAGRVTTWKRIYDSMQVVSPNSYCILEHFADNNEETELSNYGMLFWGNLNYNFNEGTMGFVSNSNFQWGIYTYRGWANPHLITYQESHDEERLMYRNLNYGNSSGAYDVKNLNTALKRNEMATAFWALIPGPKMLWQFGELGYDKSINTCEDGVTVNNNCRLSPKPILWNYQSNSNRVALYNVYARLFALRRHAPYLPTFVTNNIEYSLSSGFKFLKVTSPSLRICVVGNFDVVPVTGSVTFQSAGTWYDFLSGGTFTATGGSQSITLQPGEYHVYLDQDANAVLPLTLLSFSARRFDAKVQLDWVTVNESNTSDFQIQRSFDGSLFEAIGQVNARNLPTENHYLFKDASAQQATTTASIFYRLKMTDKDGKFTYSKVVKVDPSVGRAVTIYPNPVRNNQVNLKLEAPGRVVSSSLQDAAGKVLRTVQMANTRNWTMDLSGLASGFYFLRVEVDGVIKTYPLFINN